MQRESIFYSNNYTYIYIKDFLFQLHVPLPNLQRCFVYHNSTIVQQPIQLEQLSGAMLHDAQAFIHNSSADQPFFLYYPFVQTHTPMHNHPCFKGRSRRGTYGYTVMFVLRGLSSKRKTVKGTICTLLFLTKITSTSHDKSLVL